MPTATKILCTSRQKGGMAGVGGKRCEMGRRGWKTGNGCNGDGRAGGRVGVAKLRGERTGESCCLLEQYRE